MDTPPGIPALFPNAELKAQELPLDSHTFNILLLKDPLKLIDDTKDDDNFDVYWGELWPAGLAMADAILKDRYPIPEGPQPVLELGCGAGLVSLAAAFVGEGRVKVLATDRQPYALELAKANAARNGLGDLVEVRHVDWLEPYTDKHKLILGSDCLYAPIGMTKILTFIEAALDSDPSSLAVLADPDRWTARNFLYQAREAGFDVEVRRWNVPFTKGQTPSWVVPLSGPPSDARVGSGSIGVNLYELRRPG